MSFTHLKIVIWYDIFYKDLQTFLPPNLLMVERRIKHGYFRGPELGTKEDSWFSRNANSIISAIFIQEDIRISRLLIANMLTEAWDEEEFFRENPELKPGFNELDRMQLITHLQRLASFEGLLNEEEIRTIQKAEGRIPMDNFMPKDGSLPTFKEVESQTKRWNLGNQKREILGKIRKGTIKSFHIRPKVGIDA